MIHFFLALILALVDQVTKWYVIQPNFETITIIEGIRLLVTKNDGAAFSLPVNTYITVPLALLVILVISYHLIIKTPKFSIGLAFALILAGALGNMIDRIRFGAVTDFISVLNFPIFNLADSFITIGIVLYLWLEFIGE